MPCKSASILDRGAARGIALLWRAIAWLSMMSLAIASSSARGADDVTRARRARIQRMSAEQKSELLQSYQRFEALPAERREELRRLHAAIERDPRADELRRVMRAYHNWWTALSPRDRADLLKLDTPERLRQIKRLVERPERRAVPQLSSAELSAIAEWIVERARQMPLPPAARQRLQRLDDHQRRGVLLAIWVGRQRNPREPFRQLGADETDGFRGVLSDRARELLAQAEPPQRRRMIEAWVRDAIASQFTPASDEDLARFMVDELSADERDRLLSLPPDEMQWRLRVTYLRRHLSDVLPPRQPGRLDAPAGRAGDRADAPPRRPRNNLPPRRRPGE